MLEILEHVELTPAIAERCRQLKQNGYLLALDDVVLLTTAQLPLLDSIAYVKFHVSEIAESMLSDLVREVRGHGVRTVAEKVETEAQYERCRSIGFDFFQGYFFARPTILTGRVVQPSKILLVKLLRLLAEDADIDALEQAFKEAPDLTLRLLKTASSVGMQQVRTVRSLRNAILLVGRAQIGRILQIMLFAGHYGADFTSDPLVQTAAIRGRLMENLAEASGLGGLRGEAFMVGILSLANSVFGQSMIELLQALNLDESLQKALLHRQGPLGALLTLVEASERIEGPDFAAVSAAMPNGDAMEFNRMQIEAMGWARSL